MKRILSAIIILAIIISNMTLYVHAETNDEGATTLPDLACQVFPEYADKILGITITTRTSRSGNQSWEAIVCETRSVSDNHTITYSEYEDGLVMITSTEPSYKYSSSQNSSEISGNYTTNSVNITIWVIDPLTGLSYDTARFELRNVVYTINRSGYDRIDNVGVPNAWGISDNKKCVIDTIYTPTMTESASGSAMIKYRLTWVFGADEATAIQTVFTFRVGQNGAGITHVKF